MFDRLTLDSSNSSIPPSSDPNRKKDSKENDENESDSNTPSGQLGHPLLYTYPSCRRAWSIGISIT
jgi:hypothetical protein